MRSGPLTASSLRRRDGLAVRRDPAILPDMVAERRSRMDSLTRVKGYTPAASVMHFCQQPSHSPIEKNNSLFQRLIWLSSNPLPLFEP